MADMKIDLAGKAGALIKGSPHSESEYSWQHC
jgi:hypothetical protein